jgi:hypothetical protein
LADPNLFQPWCTSALFIPIPLKTAAEVHLCLGVDRCGVDRGHDCVVISKFRNELGIELGVRDAHYIERGIYGYLVDR